MNQLRLLPIKLGRVTSFVLAATIGALGVGCAGKRDAEEQRPITVAQLFSHPKSYAGKRICVEGIAYMGREYQFLQQADEGSYPTRVVWWGDDTSDEVFEKLELARTGDVLTACGVIDTYDFCWPRTVEETGNVCVPKYSVIMAGDELFPSRLSN